MREFLKRKNVVFSVRRYGIDALGAMAQGLFCSLLIGTILKTLGQQFGVAFLTEIGSFASSMSGPAMAVAIGFARMGEGVTIFAGDLDAQTVELRADDKLILFSNH